MLPESKLGSTSPDAGEGEAQPYPREGWVGENGCHSVCPGWFPVADCLAEGRAQCHSASAPFLPFPDLAIPSLSVPAAFDCLTSIYVLVLA